ncbi:Acetolactate synthase, mitochondrial, partial [Quaeritorhiza haematococci]
FAPAARKAAQTNKGGIIHFEILPKNINKVVDATEAIEGDVTSTLRHLLPLISSPPAHKRDAWHAQLADWKDKYPFTYTPAKMGAKGEAGKLKPQQVIEELNRQTEHIKDRVIITTGVGQHQMWAAQYFRWRYPRSFITSGGLGTMGYGLPAAIGAKVAAPEKMVIDIDGDASFSMTGMELMTARQFDVGVKVLILNNDFQGMVNKRVVLREFDAVYNIVEFRGNANVKTVDVVYELVKKKANIHVKRKDDGLGHVEVVRYFLFEMGADVHAEDDAVLRYAAGEGRVEVVRVLLGAGADVNADHGAPLCMAAGVGYLHVVKILLAAGADVHEDNDIALAEASAEGHVEMVRVLLEAGADVHADNDAALCMAAERGEADVVRMLLVEAGADLHARNNYALQWLLNTGLHMM